MTEQKKGKSTASKSTKSKGTGSKSTSSRSRTSSPSATEGASGAGKKTVSQIVAERIIAKIQESNLMPWQRPFRSACINWFTEREYTGINPYLLWGGSGEFITWKQLEKYNERHNTTYRIKDPKAFEIVVFFKPHEIDLTEDRVKELQDKGFGWLVRRRADGSPYRLKFTLRYYRVYDIADIEDENGNKLPTKLGVTLFVRHTDADKIMNGYLQAEKIPLIKGFEAAYIPLIDTIESPPPEHYESSEAYYRTIFHEMVHSTGPKKRLDREVFHKYHNNLRERSREELIAEVGAQLLATEAGFTQEDSKWHQNSMEYIHSWCRWMKDNPDELLKGVSQAEKAVKFILQRAGVEEGDTVGTEDLDASITDEQLEEAVASVVDEG